MPLTANEAGRTARSIRRGGRESRSIGTAGAAPLPSAAAAVLVATLMVLPGCVPALRFRPPETLRRAQAEVVVGGGGGGVFPPQAARVGEAQVAVRVGLTDRFELGGRLFSSRFDLWGGGVVVRAQIVRTWLRWSVDGGLSVGGCCTLTRVRGGGIGLDVGTTLGIRFDDDDPAPYVAPHLSAGVSDIGGKRVPVQLSVPVGVDLPMRDLPVRLSVELASTVLFVRGEAPRWGFGGGLGVGVRLPPLRTRPARSKELDRTAPGS